MVQAGLRVAIDAVGIKWWDITINGGISHSPKEFTPTQDMANGADVLLQTLLAIDAGALEQ